MTIKNVVVDLGGVLINLKYQLTSEAFRKLGVTNFDELYTQHAQVELFSQFETGKITSEEFRFQLRERLDLIVSDEKLDAAWNAMLLDLNKAALEHLKCLYMNSGYNVILFSNTNEIHLKAFQEICQRELGQPNLKGFLHKEYYSCRYGKMKPYPESFTALLEENGFKASETIFFDDTDRHIKGAQAAGLHTYHIANGKTLSDGINSIEALNVKLLSEERRVEEQARERVGYR